MKAFVFTENNGFIGKFEVAGIGDIREGFASFAAANPVKPYSYIECGGRVWTVMPGGNGCILAEGRQGSESIKPEKRPTSDIVLRFIEGYAAARETVGLGSFVKVIGILAAVTGCILAFELGRELIGMAVSLLTGLVLYTLGAMLATQGRILKATLDTAANTSPNLDAEDRAQLMSIAPGE